MTHFQVSNGAVDSLDEEFNLVIAWFSRLFQCIAVWWGRRTDYLESTVHTVHLEIL